MPRQRHYYEPIMQENVTPDLSEVQLAGFEADGATYVRLSDIVGAVELYASTVEMPERGLVMDIARWLAASDTAEAEEDPGVAVRVEVFPDADGKWHARSIAENGQILKVTNGSFDEHYVIKDASDRWPGLQIYRIQHEEQDTMWQQAGRFGPSHRLWTGTPS